MYLPIFLILAGYILGSIPFGVLISRLRYKIDIREIGSGNIGATNVLRSFGWGAGLSVFILDFLKGWGLVWSAQEFGVLNDFHLVLLSIATVLGHCYSLFLGFNGGKGVATGFGTLLALSPPLAGLALAGYIFGFFVSRVSAVGSMIGGFCATVASAVGNYSLASKTLVTFLFFITLMRHQQNIRKLWQDNNEAP